MAVRAGRQEFSVRQAADYLGVDVRHASGLLDQGRIGGPFRGGRQLISRASLERYLDRFGGREGLWATLREEKRQQARDRKAAICEARTYQRRVHDQAAQESLTRAREALWAIERRKSRERREKFEQLAAIDERAAGRFLLDTEPKKTPPATARPQVRHRTNAGTSLSALKRDARLAVRLAHDQADGLTLQARLAQGVRFRSSATNTTSIKGEKRNRTIAKLIRSWHLFKKGGDSKGMAEAAEQLARLGITRS
jgi:excisionase family DNA binding protein